MYKILEHKENIVIKTKKIKENEGRYLYNIINIPKQLDYKYVNNKIKFKIKSN